MRALFALAALFVGANALDCWTTLAALAAGNAEGNPAVAAMLAGPPALFWGVKVGGAVALAAFVLMAGRAHPAGARNVLLLSTLALIGVSAHNLALA